MRQLLRGSFTGKGSTNSKSITLPTTAETSFNAADDEYIDIEAALQSRAIAKKKGNDTKKKGSVKKKGSAKKTGSVKTAGSAEKGSMKENSSSSLL